MVRSRHSLKNKCITIKIKKALLKNIEVLLFERLPLQKILLLPSSTISAIVMQLSHQGFERFGISIIIPQNLWKGLEFLLQLHFLNDELASLTIPICLPIQVLPKTPEDVDLLTSTECSDGSFVFRFGNASEIREKIVNIEVDHNLREEIESSSIAAVATVDDNPQLLVNEKQIEDGEHGILSEDVADECNVVPISVSEEDPQVDDDKVVIVSTVIPESNSNILSDQNSDAVGEVDEKVDDGHNGRNG
ncbi:hypothetical protein SESBI_50690 [Sesbania bispinosa]|nr:hypothetical protein SESBI_50690 [Sesbania bispinosa]